MLTSKAVRAIVSSNSVDYVNRVFDAYNNGHVVMTIRSVDDRERLDACPADSVVHCDAQRGWSGPVPALDPANDGAAHIQFSSGTEGRPKAIVLSHRALTNTTDRLHVISHASSEIREYVAGAVTHSFGLARCRLISRVGGRYFLPENGLDTVELATMIEAGEINAISAVPTQWRVLLRNPSLLGPVGDQIRWIEIGSQYMSAEEKITVKQLFPNANIVQHYGLTEASRSTFLKIHDSGGEQLESVGQAIGRTQFRIESDGAISVKGPHLADGILKDGKIEPLTDADGWLRTSDSGREIDGDLYFLGRRDDLINCGGLKYAPEQLERHLAPELQKLAPKIDFAISKAADDIRGEAPLVVWHEDANISQNVIEDCVRASLDDFSKDLVPAVKFLSSTDIPRTDNGKVRRAELAQRYAAALQAQQSDEPPKPACINGRADSPAQSLEGLQLQIADIWETALGRSNVDRHSDFFDAGGDSLTAMTVMTNMQAAGFDDLVALEVAEGKSIARIAEDALRLRATADVR